MWVQYKTDLFYQAYECIYTEGRQDTTVIKWLIKIDERGAVGAVN